MDLGTVWIVCLLIFGFGFVVFVHELGHFLAAKWAGVKVEQFAVGFGQALLAYRQGVGVRIGSTRKDYERKVHEQLSQQGVDPNSATGGQLAQAETAAGVSETEYRINWIPLGGYVKMLGQDDLKPGAEADDPRAYNRKSVGKRMVIVSAGVIMNIILAAIGFMVLFLSGFHAPAPVVGSVMPLSPAQSATNEKGEIAPPQPGDTIVELDGSYAHDFTSVMLNTALLDGDEPAKLVIDRRGGGREALTVQARPMPGDPTSLLRLGISPASELRGPEVTEQNLETDLSPQRIARFLTAVRPGDVITHVQGQPVGLNDYYVLHEALQKSGGNPVEITVENTQKQPRQEHVRPLFSTTFTQQQQPLNFLGLLPRTEVAAVTATSPALGKLMPGDVIVKVVSSGDQLWHPSRPKLIEWLNSAGQHKKAVELSVQREGQVIALEPITPSVKIREGRETRYGLGVELSEDDRNAVVAGTLAQAGQEPGDKLPAGARVVSVNGQPVQSWFDVHQVLRNATGAQEIEFAYQTDAGDSATARLAMSEEQARHMKSLQYTHRLQLHDLIKLRKTSNPIEAAQWGVVETRDFVLQFYLTLRRMVTGDISYKNMLGPVGIFHAGTKISERGYDWLLWFLCMISANLAVVNFLPIPIVDGGLFTFLILEKIQGKPLSPRAQSIAQVVGLALLLGIFLLVTYQDISRLFHI